MKLNRTDRGPSLGYDLIVRGGSVVTGGLVGTPANAGYPLHLRGLDLQIAHSFGIDDPTLDPRRLASTNDDPSRYLNRQLTPAGSTFWAYNNFRFLLERYDFQGHLLSRVRHALDGWYAAATEREPSSGEFRGLALHDVQVSATPGIVWLVYHAARSDYPEPHPAATLDIIAWAKGHDLIVEAFDTERLQVLASRRFPSTRALKVAGAPDVLAFQATISDVFFTFRLVTLRLVQPYPQAR